MVSFLFTSESVNEGHPDKLCDQVSDAILDACLAEDPDSKVACETCTKTGMVMVGKDPTKVDRSGAYIVRQAAKSVVAAGLARRCLVQVSYAIGVAEPLSVFVDTYGSGRVSEQEILDIIKENFDFRPGMIIQALDLNRGGNKRFQKTAAYGHFGRDDPDFTWETVKVLMRDGKPVKVIAAS
ncbi:hypothetical protein CBR_g50962 [Chara braunii]|uniref:methionine adenosyltransferase n=1 Tax=Chara braunii TaxID=69332 RepID=A0A388M7Q4_CHABU|nr:hypothetical protein CBR_g50962 [Chara braunii]|eukprot:GBG90618.1 hypothetical protein CBR_g50962 [Chara braunii]